MVPVTEREDSVGSEEVHVAEPAVKLPHVQPSDDVDGASMVVVSTTVAGPVCGSLAVLYTNTLIVDCAPATAFVGM